MSVLFFLKSNVANRVRVIEKSIFTFFLILSFGFTQAQTYTSTVDFHNTYSNVDTLFRLSMEELLNTPVTSSSLTKVKNRLSPVPVVLITEEDIKLSGARSLDELLEIYTPGFTMMYKANTGNSLGMRGIISDRNNKVLLLVNGKIMNDRTQSGAISERFMTMLNDIEKIEVIQSPLSSLYGPGAISMVINIYTKSGTTDGSANEVQVTQGTIDQFTNLQSRHSKQLNEDLSYSVYYGGDMAQGASQANAPTKFSFDERNSKSGDTIISDEAILYPVQNLNASPYGMLRHKAHAQIDYKKWSTWLRYGTATFRGTLS